MGAKTSLFWNLKLILIKYIVGRDWVGLEQLAGGWRAQDQVKRCPGILKMFEDKGILWR